MKREADLVAQSDDGKVCIYIDTEKANSILDYIGSSKKNIKRFGFIKGVVLEGLRNDCFKREIEDNNIRDIYAMRFDLHGTNGRIYCKQVAYQNKVAYVMGELLPSKKTEGNGPKEKSAINRVHSYDYDCQ